MAEIDRLLSIMAQLRDPETGCPWDVEQSFATIAPYTIEEAYEVADAITRGAMDDLKDELGDLLLQVVFHARMAEEAGLFAFNDVASSISDKMIRRHPHVFGEADQRSSDGQTIAWEEQKAAERAERGDQSSALDGVALALPALLRALKLQKRAARVGFDWAEAREILGKIREEIDELEAELASDAASTPDPDRVEDELGDVLFVMANLARRLDQDPEAALRRANAKFTRRFKAMEALATEAGEDFAALDLDAQEALWQRVKAKERGEDA